MNDNDKEYIFQVLLLFVNVEVQSLSLYAKNHIESKGKPVKQGTKLKVITDLCKLQHKQKD